MDRAEFVPVRALIPDIVEDLRYATDDNFTGASIYTFQTAWLRRGTAEKLARVQSLLEKQGFRLKIWDAFRPLAAQFRMWEVCPDDDYVADPTHGGCSRHNRGSAVDVTLLRPDGGEVEMPTAFDDFTGAARRDFPDWTAAARAHSLLLEQAMTACGFLPYIGEWWHYNDAESYPLDRVFSPPPAPPPEKQATIFSHTVV